MPKIEYKGVGNISQDKAQIYGPELHKLVQKYNGKIKTEQIVEEAKLKNSPIHDYFEWDNTKAAEKFRLQQARNLIASIVEVVIIDKEKHNQRSFYSVQDVGSTTSAYVTLSTAINNDDYRSQLIDEITAHLENTLRLLKLFKQKKF